MTDSLPAFRLGDIRGEYPTDINESFALAFAHAFVHHFGITGTIATGRDVRASSASLQDALNLGLLESGINTIDLGLCTTELGYFASTRDSIQAVIIVTASHNPARHNGFKCVLKHGEAVSFDTGLSQVMYLMINEHRNTHQKGKLSRIDYQSAYIDFLGTQFRSDELVSHRVALNGLNGTAATLAVDIASQFEIPVSWFRKTPGPIPEQGADPANALLVQQMGDFMQGQDLSLGITWDIDCDRCVFFDPNGQLVPTYYVIGLLAEHFLKQTPGASIVYDTKLRWNTLDIIQQYQGNAIAAATGHAFMKRAMKRGHAGQGAVYGGELSSHHYFGNFFYCDSGMFAWLTMLKFINQSGQSSGESIIELIQRRRNLVCCTAEISVNLIDSNQAFIEISKHYCSDALSVDLFDGLSCHMPGDWRFSLCRSKTESSVRLNLESRGDPSELLAQGAALLTLLEPFRADQADWQQQLRIQ